MSWHPNVSREEKIRLLQTLSVLSVPAMYGESFGLYVIEAMAAGVFVTQPDHAHSLKSWLKHTERGSSIGANPD